MSKATIAAALSAYHDPENTPVPAAGEGTPAGAAAGEQSIIIIRNFQPGQVVRVVFITPEQAKALPIIPDNALQIAIAPAGGI